MMQGTYVKFITYWYSERVFVALGFQHAMNMRHIFCGLFGYKIFPYYLINSKAFEKIKLIEHNMSAFFSSSLPETFLFLQELNKILSYMYIGLLSKYSLFSSDFNET